MSKFGDLIAGVSGVPVVETPAPVVEEAPAPVAEEAPRPEEEVADIVAAPVDFNAMSKDELEDYGRTVGIELDSCLLYTSPSPRDPKTSRMPSSA